MVLAAGFSEALGHSLTLFVNRVRLRRFALALLFVALSWSLGFLLWFSSIWAVAGWFGQDLVWYDFIRTLSFACLPLCALFLNALPYFGVAISVVLTFYSLLCVVTGIEALTDLGTLQAFACAAFGWVVLQLLQRTAGRPMVALGKQLERRFAGAAVRSDRQGLAELVRVPAAAPAVR